MSATSLPHGEAWLIELGVRYELPICGLARSDEDLHLWLLKGGHGLSRLQLHDTLRRLFDSLDIHATIQGRDDLAFNPSDRHLDAALRRRDCTLYYGLTEQGGARWETLTSPKWKRFFDRDGGVGDNHMRILAGSRSRLIDLMQKSEILWGVRVIGADPLIEEFRPWMATPWKTLEVGYRADVAIEDVDSPVVFKHSLDIRRYREYPEDYQSTRSWCSSLLGHADV